jgi:hypothetical protein
MHQVGINQKNMSYMLDASKPQDYIRDIWDGEKVQRLRQRGWFRKISDIGLVLSTDGGNLFKRTGVNAWPVWASIANLPPEER